MAELMGHHAIVTGAGSGAGEAIALALAGKGARVTAIGRRLAPLEALAAQDDRIIAVSADVTDAHAMAAAIAEAVEKNGAPTIVIANAGSAESAPFQRTDAALFRAALDVNLTGVFNTFQASFVKMNRAQPGRLIAIASTAGLKGYAYVGLLRGQARGRGPRPQPGAGVREDRRDGQCHLSGFHRDADVASLN